MNEAEIITRVEKSFGPPSLQSVLELRARHAAKSAAIAANVPLSSVYSKRRHYAPVLARHTAWWLLYNDGDLYSKSEIARLFKGHHSAVIHGLRRIETELELDSRDRRVIDRAKALYDAGDGRHDDATPVNTFDEE